ALDGAIARGEYQQVLARWGEQGQPRRIERRDRHR
ncbi:hypothetical protein ACMWGK_13040, partial [Klebsiella pneumoniae]